MAQPQRNDLKEFIVDCFSRDEFITFCADYFRDFYEDYEGADLPKSALANKLVEFCERRDDINKLRANLQRVRRESYLAKFEPVRLAEVVTQPRNPRQVFLSHAHEDADFARRLAADLREAGLSVWMTPDSIQPGESWVSAIDRGLSESGIFIVVLTPSSVRSQWVKKETQWALQAEQNKLVRLVPLQVQPCDVAQLSNLLTLAQYVNFENGYEAGAIVLFRALGLQRQAEQERWRDHVEAPAQVQREAAREHKRQLQAELAHTAQMPNNTNSSAPMSVGKTRVSRRAVMLGLGGVAAGGVVAAWVSLKWPVAPTFLNYYDLLPTERSVTPTTVLTKLTLELASGVTMPLVRVPAGEFLMGSDKAKDTQAADDEQPQHRVFLSEYAIGKYEITAGQYAAFVNASGYKSTVEQVGNLSQKNNHPVTNVSWDDATAFCAWASKQTSEDIHLPTEAQWEKAARGIYGQIYPWGDEFDARNANTVEGGKGDTTPVGAYSSQSDSPFGAADMAGNLWEWCVNWYDANAYKDLSASQIGDYRVVRGGSWVFNHTFARTAARFRYTPGFRNNNVGFPVVVNRLSPS